MLATNLIKSYFKSNKKYKKYNFKHKINRKIIHIKINSFLMSHKKYYNLDILVLFMCLILLWFIRREEVVWINDKNKNR